MGRTKKIFLSVVAVFLGFIAVGQDVVVWEDETNKLKYTQIGSTNNVRVQKIGNNDGEKPTGNLEIPSHILRKDTVNGTVIETVYTVTEIASDGFYQVHGLSEVRIPNTVTKIGDNAFMQAGSHANPFTIDMSAANIKEIGASAFQGCNTLLSITLPEGLEKIGDLAFASTKITEIKWPSTLDSLGSSAFADCHELRTVEFNSWVSIGANAFQNCGELGDITGPCGLSLSDIGLQPHLMNTVTNNYDSNCMLITKKDGGVCRDGKTNICLPGGAFGPCGGRCHGLCH